MRTHRTEPAEAWRALEAADPVGRSLDDAAGTPQAMVAYRSIVSGAAGDSVRARRRPPRAVRALAGATGLLAVAALVGLLVIAAPSGTPGPAASGSLRPDVGSLGPLRACGSAGVSHGATLRIACVDGADAVRRANRALSGDAWLYRPPGRGLPRLARSPRKPSLVFPPGTTYGQALDALLVSVTLTGRLPAGTTVGPPLPDGTVLLRPRDRSRGIAIDLRAPFGYSGRAGTVYGVTFLSRGRPETGGGLLWPAGARVAVPTLPACQVATTRAARPLRCTAGDEVAIRGIDRSVAPLPAVRLGAPPREAAPDLDLPVLSGPGAGAHLRLASLRGRVVILTAFASWCAPCARSTTAAAALATRYAGRDDVAVIGLDVSDRPGPARRFVRRHDLRYTVVRAPGAEAARLVNPLPQLGAPRGAVLPVTFLIDRQGRIARRLPGALLPSRVGDEVDRLLREAP
jgi:peroxiredoxin